MDRSGHSPQKLSYPYVVLKWMRVLVFWIVAGEKVESQGVKADAVRAGFPYQTGGSLGKVILPPFGAGAHAGDNNRAADDIYYHQQVQRQIEICQSKTALQFSRFENVRELGRTYGLKLAFLTRQQDQLVAEMASAAVAAKPYRVSRFINADFHKTLEKYNLARR